MSAGHWCSQQHDELHRYSSHYHRTVTFLYKSPIKAQLECDTIDPHCRDIRGKHLDLRMLLTPSKNNLYQLRLLKVGMDPEESIHILTREQILIDFNVFEGLGWVMWVCVTGNIVHVQCSYEVFFSKKIICLLLLLIIKSSVYKQLL